MCRPFILRNRKLNFHEDAYKVMGITAAFIISQSLSVLIAIACIVTEQLKTMKHILIVQTLINLTVALSYLLLPDGKTGFIVSTIGALQAIVMFFCDKKGKKPHFTVTIGFCMAYVFLSLYNNTDKIINFFPAAAAVCFALALTQKKPKVYRIFDFSNATLWMVYDACILSGNFFVHLGVALSAAIGMIRLDGLFGFKKTTNNVRENENGIRKR
jgi:hypothetical protein